MLKKIIFLVFILFPLKLFSMEELEKVLFFLEESKAEKALELLLPLKEKMKDNKEFWVFYALSLSSLKDFDKAEEAYKKALELSSEELFLLRQLALLYYEQGAYKKAYKTFEKAALLSDDFEDHYGLALCLYELKDFNAAIKLLYPIAKKEEKETYLRLLAHLCLSAENKEKEIVEFLRSFFIKSQNREDLRLLSELEELAGHYFRAAFYLEIYLNYKKSSDLEAKIAFLYERAFLPVLSANYIYEDKLKKIDTLIKAGKKGAALLLLADLKGSEARLMEAEIYIKKGVYSKALKSLEKADKSFSSLYMQGFSLWQLKFYSEAERSFRKARAFTDKQSSLKELKELEERMSFLKTLEESHQE